MPPASDRSDRQPDSDLTPATAGHASPELNLTLPADWITPSIVRDRVRRWLGAHGWPASQVIDLVLAVSEAVSNSIEHGYGIGPDDYSPGALVELACQVEVEADGFRRAVLVVRDEGRWREPASAPTATRGHGTTMMRACVDELTVEHDRRGTRTTMRSHPVPPALRA